MKSAENEIEPTAIRACAAMLTKAGFTNAPDYLRRKADEIAPLDPDIPDGTLCIAKLPLLEYAQVCGYKGEWGLYHVAGYNHLLWHKKHITNIRPVRPLEPGQVAVYQEVLMNAEYLLKYRGSFARSIAAQLRDALDRDTEAE